MASTVLTSRNQASCGYQAFMGEIPNYSNSNLRHLNPNPNPNQKHKSNKKKHFPNGRLYNHNSHAVDSCGVVASQAVSDEAYSFNQRPIETSGVAAGNGCFDHGAYVIYNVAAYSRSEINDLRKKLATDLERIRNLNDRIQVVDLNPRSSNGKFKKLPGSKRLVSSMPFVSSNKEAKHVRQGLVNGVELGEGDENLMKMCRQVLTKLMKHKLSWVFNKPVDAAALKLHDYHQIIKRPMDLGSVKLNLSKNLYSSSLDFASDVRLVFENAMLYNPKTDEVHGMAHQLLSHFEGLLRPIQAKLATHYQVNGFSAADEFDQSSGRSKKLKPSRPVVPAISNKQNHSTVSNQITPPIPTVVQSPARTPSPMQVTEPIKPSSTATRGAVAKLPKPRAKDPDKREMNIEEKQKLGLGLQSMPPEKMPQLLQIIRKRNDQLAQEGDEIELDIEALETETLWELDRFVANWKKLVSKTKRQGLLVNNAFANIDIDIDDVPLSEKIDGMKKNKKEAGEEDVDIGDEMLESSFPHVEIEKDDGGGQGQAAVTGHGNENANANASSSSSGSSSSSSGDSSSSSDSDSGSSSGSDSDADDAQS